MDRERWVVCGVQRSNGFKSLLGCRNQTALWYMLRILIRVTIFKMFSK